MNEMTLERLRKVASSGSFTNQYYWKIEELLKDIEESGISAAIEREEHILYPKNLFREEDSLHLYFISQDSIVTCKRDQDEVFIENIPLSNPYKLQIRKLSVSKHTAELIIHIPDEQPISLSNVEDTNEKWQAAFYKYILDIYIFLS